MRARLLLCAVLCCFLAAATALAQDPIIGFRILNQTVTEDDVTLQVDVLRVGSLAGTASADYAIFGSSARAGVDFVAGTGTVTFGDTEGEKTISVTLLDDNESDQVNPRVVEVELTNFVNASPATWSRHFIAIEDDEPPPEPLTLSYSNLTHSEGDGVTSASFTVTLSHAHDQPVMASLRRSSWPGDYNGAEARNLAQIYFAPGQTSIQIPLEIHGNDAYDGPGPKSFHFSVIPGIVPITAPDFDILLTEDDPQPTVSIADVSVGEGSCGPTPIEITLTTSYTAYGTVQWTAGDGTATAADVDYGPYGIHEPVRFLNSTTAKLTLVAPYGDLKIEDDETFFVTLTSATNMLIGDGTGAVTIENDDASLPSFLDDDMRIEAGKTSTLTIRFPAPAPKGAVKLTSSDARVKVPASVNVSERATSVSFPAEATEAAGLVTITADLPGSLGDTKLTAIVDAFRDTALDFDGPRRVLFPGETATASLALDPPRDEPVTVMLTASSGIVMPESVLVPARGAVEFPFTALAAGHGTITGRYGESTESLMIEIASQQVQSFAPESGSATGGTAITLHGAGFSPGCIATFGTLAAQTTFVDAQTLIATTPAHVAGNVNVMVTCGVTPVAASGEFEFVNARRRSSRH